MIDMFADNNAAGIDINKLERLQFDQICKFTPRQRVARHQFRIGKQKILYGGALGGGKSFFLRWFLLWYLMMSFEKYDLENVEVMLACEDYPTLKDRQISKISKEFPPEIGDLKDNHKVHGKCFLLHPEYGGGAILLRNLDDPSKYQSAEFAACAVDELTKNEYDVFTLLDSRLRWPGIPDSRTLFVGGTNPGGKGHGWCKQLWMEKDFGDEWIEPIDFRHSFAYVPSKASDNPYLDKAYWNKLQTLPEHLRAAFRDGSWDLYIGQAFPEFGPRHKVNRIEFPDHWPRIMTFDWGFGKPFSVGWWRVDPDGRLWRVREWYGWNHTADTGLRLDDDEIAKGIIEREKRWGWAGKTVIRLCDPTCMNKKPNYNTGGGQSDSTNIIWSRHGLHLSPGDPARKNGLTNVRIRIKVPEGSEELPMLVVCKDECKQSIRTIPNINMDSANIEDIDTDSEDHIYDDWKLICNARPILPRTPVELKPRHVQHIEDVEKPKTNNSRNRAKVTGKRYNRSRLS